MIDESGYTYLQEILDQPAALELTVASLAAEKLPETMRSAVRGARRIVLTGMGSSYYALLPLYRRLVSAGLPVSWWEAGELLLTGLHRHPETLIVAASQSGASAEIVRLTIERDTSQPLIGITNTP